jgi:hypothetical protein
VFVAQPPTRPQSSSSHYHLQSRITIEIFTRFARHFTEKTAISPKKPKTSHRTQPNSVPE